MRRCGEARALVINGCFLHQYFVRSTLIDHIQSLCSELSEDREILARLPQCLEGFCAVETPQKMERYIEHQDVPPPRVQAADVIDRQLVGQTTYHELRWTK